MARFSGIPEIPEGLGQEWAPALIGALKQNVELLAGIRGEQDQASAAVLKGELDVSRVMYRGSITANRVPPPNLTEPSYDAFEQVTASGQGFKINNVDVASLEDHVDLIEDVSRVINNSQRVANDLTRLFQDVRDIREVLNSLTEQFRE